MRIKVSILYNKGSVFLIILNCIRYFKGEKVYFLHSLRCISYNSLRLCIYKIPIVNFLFKNGIQPLIRIISNI